MERNRTQLRGAALLMLTALIWGTAFVAQSVGMDHLGPCAFTAVRNYIGCVALLPVIAFASRLRKGKPEDDGEQVPPAKARKRLALWGAACGLLLGSATLLQQAGMQTASPGKAGFLTALYIVIVPVLGVFLGRRPGLKVWAGVVLALGLEHSRQATQAQSAVTEMTNQLLQKNADMLKIGTVETAREAERSIVDIKTLQHTNEQLISTLDEVMKIQNEGSQKRKEAEVELGRIEGELKQKLLELRG